MDKRFLLALVISALVLLGYPHYLRWIGVTPATDQKKSNETSLRPEKASLPAPKPAAPPSTSKTVPYQNELYDIRFTERGGAISFLKLKEGDATLYRIKPEENGIFGITIQDEPEDLTEETFLSLPSEGRNQEIAFTYEKPSEYRLTKKYYIGSDRPTMVLEVVLENLSDREKEFPLVLKYLLEVGPPGSPDESLSKLARFAAGEIHLTSAGKLRKTPLVTMESLDWHGLTKKYYALLVKPEEKLTRQSTHFEEDRLVSEVNFAPLLIGSGEKKTTRILIYAGPQRYVLLKEFGFGFEKILSAGALGFLKTVLLVTLNFFNGLARNYGVAILVVTVLIKLLFTPLTHLSFESMRKMQALQPKLKALQKQYKNDGARLNKEMMELYRRNRVNPMMGCLPLFLQVPIFISFYQVLSEAVELKGAGFMFWIHDLSEPDSLFSWPTSLPFIGNSFNLLPVLMIGSMLWQQKLTPQSAATPEQEKIMYFMPIIFGFVFYSLPSGLVLYWLVNNLLSIFHQLVIKRIPVILHHEDR